MTATFDIELDGNFNTSKTFDELGVVSETIEVLQIVADSHEALFNTFRVVYTNGIEVPVSFVPSTFLTEDERKTKVMYVNIDGRQILNCSDAKIEIDGNAIKPSKYTVKYNIPEGGFIP